MRWLWCAAVLCATAHGRVVYETGFENEMQLPPGWSIESYGPGPDWGVGGNPSDWHMRVRFGPGGDQDEWLISPELDLSSEQGVSVHFWQWFRSLGNGVAQVRVSLDGGQNWETVVEYGTDQANIPEVPVPQADGQAHVRFCWRYLASLDYEWDIDDVQVHAEVPVDLQIIGTRGPSAADYLRLNTDLVTRVAFRNLGNQPSPAATVRFSTAHGVVTANIPSGIAPDDTSSFSYTVDGSLFPITGDEALTVAVAAPGDAVADNDTVRVSPLHVIDDFPSPAATLLNYDDPADSALFGALLAARGVQYDSWNRKAGGADMNLYGLECWRIVVFTETQVYPALREQFALMRFLDQPSPGLRRGLLISGDDWLQYTNTGAVTQEFTEIYLGVIGGQEVTTDLPSLFPVPGNQLGFDQILSTNAVRPDIVETNPLLPNAELVLAYDQALDFGAMGTYRTASYQTVAAGFEWGQLIVHDEQVALAGSCLDWMLAARGGASLGEAFQLDLSPNPATDRIRFRIPGSSGMCTNARLMDMAGRRAAAWDMTGMDTVELQLPESVVSGAYCLVVAPLAGGLLSERVIVWR